MCRVSPGVFVDNFSLKVNSFKNLQNSKAVERQVDLPYDTVILSSCKPQQTENRNLADIRTLAKTAFFQKVKMTQVSTDRRMDEPKGVVRLNDGILFSFEK